MYICIIYYIIYSIIVKLNINAGIYLLKINYDTAFSMILYENYDTAFSMILYENIAISLK